MVGVIDERALRLLLEISETEFARFKDLNLTVQNPRTLSLKLRKLESLGLVSRAGGGYKITEPGKRAAEVLQSYTEIVGGRPKLLNLGRIPHAIFAPVVRKYCELLYDSYHARLEGVILFGSVAKGTWTTDSDIDLLVLVQGWEGKKVWERVSELSEVKAALAVTPEFSAAVKEGFWSVVQHIPFSLEELRSFRPIYLDIAFDGLLLFDRVGLMERFVDSVKTRAKRLGTKRITLPDGGSYWVMNETEAGEVVALGQQS